MIEFEIAIVGPSLADCERMFEVVRARLSSLNSMCSLNSMKLRCRIARLYKGKRRAAITLLARTTTGCRIGAQTLLDEKAGATTSESFDEFAERAADAMQFQLDVGGCVDEWTVDQLLPYMALADGVSKLLVGERTTEGPDRLTKHTKDAIEAIEAMLKPLGFEGFRLFDGLLSCTGMCRDRPEMLNRPTLI